MAGTAPTEIQHIDQQEANLYKKMAPIVEQAAGQPTTPQSLKPEDETALDKIREEVENLARFTESSFGEAVSGKTGDTDIMLSRGDKAVKIAQNRGLRRGLLNRLGLKKTA